MARTASGELLDAAVSNLSLSSDDALCAARYINNCLRTKKKKKIRRLQVFSIRHSDVYCAGVVIHDDKADVFESRKSSCTIIARAAKRRRLFRIFQCGQKYSISKPDLTREVCGVVYISQRTSAPLCRSHAGHSW